jgi:hypothetical protein
MTIGERLGVFYIGKEHDLQARELTDTPLMYDARDLTTHAVCVGMTGSGKTGLCIDLLEEAAIDQVPAIIIDPKGDITNLLLTFPELRPEDFRPWVNVDDARRKDMTVEAYAAKQAETWRNGLADWGQGPERIRLLKESADFLIYTPGSDAGLPVSILSSLAAPQLDWEENQESLREQISGTVSALLGLAGIDADPVRSREHILLANIFEHYWRNNQDLDLPSLILAIQNPPVRTLGVFDVDTFFPPKDRFSLTMALNNIIASPGFASWLEGQPLDIDHILFGGDAKPNHSIFYIAHLNDAERMFFVTLLLQQVITWMRAQAGTTSLRALLYMDEVFGFFPPVGEPPSKRPLLTLLKQARAFGLGLMLTTQNPVDLDYKGLTNAGTWFIGKLQAERDKARVLEGLENVSAEAGSQLDRSYLDKLISSLGSRVFLLHNVHEDGPVTFMTRWAMSYLRGPLTRPQVRDLMADHKAATSPAPEAIDQADPGTLAGPGPEAQTRPAVPQGLSELPPATSHDTPQVYLPIQRSLRQTVRALEERVATNLEVEESLLVYEPRLLGTGMVRFVDAKRNVDERQRVTILLDPPRSTSFVAWDEGEQLELEADQLEDMAEANALFASEVPDALDSSRELRGLEKDFSDYLYRNFTYPLLHSPSLKIYAEPGEDERSFKIRLQQAARERRDAEVDALAGKLEKKIQRIETRLRREQQELSEDEAEYDARKREELLSAGESIFNMFFGRRRSSTLLSSASRRRRMTSTAKQDILESHQEIEELEEQIAELQDELQDQTDEITARWADTVDDIETFHVKPRRVDVDVFIVALAWTPRWEITVADQRGRPRTETIWAF